MAAKKSQKNKRGSSFSKRKPWLEKPMINVDLKWDKGDPASYPPQASIAFLCPCSTDAYSFPELEWVLACLRYELDIVEEKAKRGFERFSKKEEADRRKRQ